MQITHHEVQLIKRTELQRHPHNRPLGLNREKIDQIKESIKQYGFYDSQPIVVRKLPENGFYQIIKGEHRWIAASELEMEHVPCSVQDMDDEEALIQLIIGNIQTENHPLEIGLNALCVVKKASKKGLSAAAYGVKIGLSKQSVSRYLQAAIVYKHINEQRPTGGTLLQEVSHLEEIAKLPQPDWLWLHDFIVKNECSKQQVIAIVKAIKDFRNAVKDEAWYELLEILEPLFFYTTTTRLSQYINKAVLRILRKLELWFQNVVCVSHYEMVGMWFLMGVQKILIILSLNMFGSSTILLNIFRLFVSTYACKTG